jgi:hypothetical protein
VGKVWWGRAKKVGAGDPGRPSCLRIGNVTLATITTTAATIVVAFTTTASGTPWLTAILTCGAGAALTIFGLPVASIIPAHPFALKSLDPLHTHFPPLQHAIIAATIILITAC